MMKDASNRERQQAPLFHLFMFFLLAAINILLFKNWPYVGMFMVPVTVYAGGLFLVRMFAPRYIRSKVKDYLESRGGSAPFPDLVERFTASRDSRTQEDSVFAIMPILAAMEEAGEIEISENTVILRK
ncbi:MAG: hypothetical protein AB1921_02850 [Thermodesulfobacteriota bacterium]